MDTVHPVGELQIDGGNHRFARQDHLHAIRSSVGFRFFLPRNQHCIGHKVHMSIQTGQETNICGIVVSNVSNGMSDVEHCCSDLVQVGSIAIVCSIRGHQVVP